MTEYIDPPFDATPLWIGHVLKNRAPLQLMRYQRDYAWEVDDQVQDLIDDVAPLLTGAASHRFFGSLIVVRHTTPGRDRDVMYEVVDGQQRLATFCLAIAALVDGYRRLRVQFGADAELVKACTAAEEDDSDSYLYYQERVEGARQKLPRLRVTDRNRELFEMLLKGALPASTAGLLDLPSNRLMLEAFVALREFLSDDVIATAPSDPRAALTALLERRKALTGMCSIVFASTPNLREAYRLFAVVNTRGKSLEQADLLRAHTLGLLHVWPTKQQRVEEAWDSFEQLEPDVVDQFLRAYFASVKGQRLAKEHIYESYRAELFDDQDDPIAGAGDPDGEVDSSKVVETMVAMQSEIDWFVSIRQGKWPWPEGTRVNDWDRDRLRRLILALKRTSVTPLLLAARATRDEATFSRLVAFLERMDFRWLVVGAHAGSLAEMYFEHAARLRNDHKWGYDQIVADIEPTVARRASEETFRVSLPERLRYGAADQTARIAHVLTTINDYLQSLLASPDGPVSAKKMRVWDLDKIWIEHIYPQNPPAADVDPALERVTDELGNLTYLSDDDNRAASNLKFDPGDSSPTSKKTAYEKSEVELTKLVARRTKWDVAEVSERQRDLVSWVLRIYALSEDAKAKASEVAPRRRRVWPKPEEVIRPTRYWVVSQQPKSPYADAEGQVYEYPRRIPNGRGIGVGDVLICFRTKDGKHAIFGIGTVGSVEEYEREIDGKTKLMRAAKYSDWTAVKDVPLEAVTGSDPRNVARNAISEVDAEFLDELRKASKG